jgi:hypothetical protein
VDADAVQAARELLLSQGLQVLDSGAFHGIKANAAEPHKAKAEHLESELALRNAELEKLAAYKAKIEDKDKSESELWQSRLREWEKQTREYQDKLADAEKAKQATMEQLATERVHNRLRGLLTNSTDSDISLLWAQREIGERLSVDDSGNLVWTDPAGVPHVGIAAENLVKEWWQSDRQKALQTSNAPGPVTAGAAAPAPKPPEVYQQLDPAKHSPSERKAHAMKWNQDHGMPGVNSPLKP